MSNFDPNSLEIVARMKIHKFAGNKELRAKWRGTKLCTDSSYAWRLKRTGDNEITVSATTIYDYDDDGFYNYKVILVEHFKEW